MAGRITRCTPDLTNNICRLIRIGNYPEVAAGVCGVPRSTFFQWVQRGLGQHPTRKPTPQLVAFVEAIQRAMDESEARAVAKLHEYEEGLRSSRRSPGKLVRTRLTMHQVLAIQWRLSRSAPERWAARPAKLSAEVDVAAMTGDGSSSEGAGVRINVILASETAGPTRVPFDVDVDEDDALESASVRPQLPYPEELADDVTASTHPRRAR